MSSQLVVALDLESRKEIFDWADKLQSLPVVLKIGLRSLPQLAPNDIEDLKKRGFKIFIDAKLHDIPSQVAASVKSWAVLGADFLTLHLGGGRAMLEAAAKARIDSGAKIELFGVSVLTSLSSEEIKEVGVDTSAPEQVDRLVRLGLDSGLRSFVSSAQEVPSLKKIAAELKKEIHFVCPGLVFEGEAAPGDQKRVATIQEALKMGVDWPVVGRSILKDVNPRAKIEKILAHAAKG